MAAITYVCVLQSTDAFLHVQGQTVYCETRTGATGCKFDHVYEREEDLRTAVATLTGKSSGLVVVRGGQGSDALSTFVSVLSVAWDDFSLKDSISVALGARHIVGATVTDLIENGSGESQEIAKNLKETNRTGFREVLGRILALSAMDSVLGHVIVHLDHTVRPAFVTNQPRTGLTVVYLGCPTSQSASYKNRCIQLFEYFPHRLSLSELARGVLHIPYSSNPLISQIRTSLFGDKLMVSCLSSRCPDQSLYILESIGQMNSSLVTVHGKHLERVKLTAHLNALEKMMETSLEGFHEVLKLASANADLSDLYREIVTPTPGCAAGRKTGVQSRKASLNWVRKEGVDTDLSSCMLTPVQRRRRHSRLVFKHR